MTDLSTEICGVKLENPLILASGLAQTGKVMVLFAEQGAGAVTSKSITIEKRKGHPQPTVKYNDWFTINAVGLTNSGIDKMKEELKFAKENTEVPVIASIFAFQKEKFGEVAEEISKVKPDLIQVNISCPNVEDEQSKSFGYDPKIAAEVTKQVKENTDIPVIMKLTPNTPYLKEVACACEEAGADGLCCFNTWGPGMVIDIEKGKPYLSNRVGGVSGKGIKPLVVRHIYDIYETVDIPIIASGGIRTGEDCIEMMMAGASTCDIFSAIYHRKKETFSEIKKEIKNFMKENGYKNLKEIIGKAHQN